VSRGSRQRRLEAEERWPGLFQFLACYLHQDWTIEFSDPAQAIDAAISGSDIDAQIVLVREWGDWNASAGMNQDVRPSVNEGFGVEVHFERSIDARHFMNMVYDKLMVSIRGAKGKDWKA
jgi:hypothetical protein